MSQKPVLRLGLLGTLCVVGALIIFLWLMTWEPEDIQGLVTASFFLVGGLSLSYVMVGVRFETFRLTNFLGTIASTVINILIVIYINSLIPHEMQVTLQPEINGFLWGVAEECFFRLFLTGLFYRLTNNSILAIVTASLIWTNYHIAKYGIGFNTLFIIFACGCVLGATYLYTGSADGSILGHGLVNYIAFVWG